MDDTDPSPRAPDSTTPTPWRPAPLPAEPVTRPWRPVAGLAERPSRIAFSERLFFWLVYAGGLVLIVAGIAVVWLAPYAVVQRLVGLPMIIVGIAVFCFGGPSASAEKGYRD